MEKTITGKILRGLGGLYTVRYVIGDEVRYLQCRGKGIIRHQEEKLLVGDVVQVQFDDENPENTAIISSITKRKNELIRPPMANLDYLFCVIASQKPDPVLETLDKLLAIADYNQIEPIIVITKADYGMTEAQKYKEIYEKAGFKVFLLSSVQNTGVEELKTYLKEILQSGKCAAFSGASGVGKSSLLNALFPTLNLQTNTISKRVERGRHTTRAVELFEVFSEHTTCGYLADTPGFSMIDFMHFDFFSLDDLFDSFRDFAPLRGQCKYLDCTHTGEGPGECIIARKVQSGEISSTRHDSYKKLYSTLHKKEHTYK